MFGKVIFFHRLCLCQAAAEHLINGRIDTGVAAKLTNKFMPKIGNNPILKKVSGMLGDTIVFRQGPDGPIMANAPKKPKTVNQAQIALRERFLNAVQYGRRQMTKPEAKALYETGVDRKRKSAYTVAVSDYLAAPQIKQIDTDQYQGVIGQSINVHAADDFKVASVLVVIQTATGTEIERGEATLSEELRDVWIYTTKAENISLTDTLITVTAKDIPGNVVKQSLTL